jgi:hypothetical protein
MSPRDGSNVYHRPVGTDAVTDTTIESTKYNSNVADVEQDLNLPRPIVAGGTGANNATDAMTSLQGDKAYQIVTNYDSYPFISGSFYSAAGATSAPTGNAFIGHCYTARRARQRQHVHRGAGCHDGPAVCAAENRQCMGHMGTAGGIDCHA